MLRLVLWNSAETSQYDIDLYKNIPVELTYQFTNVQNINESVGDFSQTFRIPATKKNLNFFGSVIDPTVVATTGTLINDTFDIKKKIRAELSDDGVNLLKGFVQLKAIYRQKKQFHELEIILFGETIDLAKSLGDSMISDLDMSSLNHVLSYTNIALSWTGNLPSIGAESIRYGLIDKGFNWSMNAPFNAEQAPGVVEAFPFYQSNFTPYVQVRWLLDKIFETAGFSYTSTFFSHADFDKVYLPAFNGLLSPRSTDIEPESDLAAAGLASDFTLTTVTTTVALTDAASGGYDYSGNFDNTAADYTAPYGAIFTVRINLLGSVGLDANVRLIKNSAVIGSFDIDTTTPQINQVVTVYLENGDTLHLDAKRFSGSGGYLESGSGVGDNGACWFRIENVSEPISGQTIDVSANMPVCKQIDFLASLQKMYNLVIIPDKTIPKKVLIEPYKDYMSTGNKVDWTNKIDFTKDLELKPTTDIQRKEYSWQNSEGGDFVNEAVLSSLDRVYGRYRVLDSENDFATGDNAITTSFASYILSYIPGTAIPIHRCIDDSGETIEEPLPRLANWVGQSASVIGYIYMMNDSFVSTSVPFPFFSNYSAQQPDPGDEDLNYGTETPFISIDAHPANTLYWKYWAKYVKELYSNDSRIMSLFVNLTSADIHNFKFNDEIYIENSYWRVLSIDNYDATTNVPTKVKLIKVLSDLALCADTPTGHKSTTNEITFNNSNIDYGSQTCCELYGYVWRPRISRCYPAGTQSTPTVNE